MRRHEGLHVPGKTRLSCLNVMQNIGTLPRMAHFAVYSVKGKCPCCTHALLLTRAVVPVSALLSSAVTNVLSFYPKCQRFVSSGGKGSSWLSLLLGKGGMCVAEVADGFTPLRR